MRRILGDGLGHSLTRRSGYAMQEHTTIPFPHPQLTAADPLTEVLRQGAQRVLAQAIEAEVAVLFAQYADCRGPQGHPR
jgi:hypothetical protein